MTLAAPATMLYVLLSFLSSVVWASCLLADKNNGTMLNSYNNGITKRQITRKVNLDVYYECLCPDSIRTYLNELIPVMRQLGPYINLRIFPYGKASTRIQNGMITFQCQHGEKECYGNKLHACAMEQLPFWLEFNACLMSDNSNDEAADKCASMFNIDSQPIKTCANGARGTQLLAYYGQETAKVSFNFIPHIEINGSPMENGVNLMATAVSNAIKNAQNL